MRLCEGRHQEGGISTYATASCRLSDYAELVGRVEGMAWNSGSAEPGISAYSELFKEGEKPVGGTEASRFDAR